jgi:DNA-binding MarR family transcriptional regulator
MCGRRNTILEGKDGAFAAQPLVEVMALDHRRVQSLAALACHASCRVVEHAGGDAQADYLLADLSSETERLPDFLSGIVRYLDAGRSIAVIWTSLEQLDNVYAALPQGQCHWLVEGSDLEAIPILTGAIGKQTMNRLHERDREADFGSLHRISDELAEFARTIARMAEEERGQRVADKPVSFRPAPIALLTPITTGASQGTGIDARALRDIIKARRLRDRFFSADLFADPAWDILLDLKAAELEGASVSVSSLCIAAAVPPTTALRWITAMSDDGMLVRRQDPDDARRVFIALSDEASAAIESYFAAMAGQHLKIV